MKVDAPTSETIRRQVVEALAAAAPAPPQEVEDAERAELERRRQALAPEALAGDPDAVAELDAIEGEIQRLDREAELGELAAREQADRNRQAAAEEAERQRTAWSEQLESHSAARDAELRKVERALQALVKAIPAALREDGEAQRLRRLLDPSARARRLTNAIESRVLYQLREADSSMRPGVLLGREGAEPLV